VIYATNSQRFKLPADAQHPLLALSMQRKLRYLYDGEFFKYREGSNEYTYPNRHPGDNAYLVEIYDQKEKHGFDKFNAVQYDPSKQPKVLGQNSEYYASFELGQYLELEGNPASYVQEDFTITIIGDSDFPRPLFSVFGDEDFISVEPGSPTNRFSFNSISGSISENSNNRINQLFSGVDPSQNNKRVITMKSDGAGRGQNLSSDISTEFTTIAIGKSKTRLFTGKFIEVTMHLGDLSEVGSDKLWEEAKLAY
jgi:hypothetical protein